MRCILCLIIMLRNLFHIYLCCQQLWKGNFSKSRPHVMAGSMSKENYLYIKSKSSESRCPTQLHRTLLWNLSVCFAVHLLILLFADYCFSGIASVLWSAIFRGLDSLESWRNSLRKSYGMTLKVHSADYTICRPKPTFLQCIQNIFL